MRRYPWLFSPTVDLAVFLGSAVASLGLLVVGAFLGLLASDTPEWAWVPAVLLIDVAHVWATGFRVYFDREERRRRPVLYIGTPVLAYAVGFALYSVGPAVFWRTLAYMAVFHFVRQQYGWVALYRNRGGERDRLGFWIDTIAIYAATVFPLLYWHANLPRSFWWFLPGDFHALPRVLVDLAYPIYVVALIAYAIRSLRQWQLGAGNPGKDIVLVTTALCWYAGIILFNSDYAFTVTNVVIHGVPYFVLVYCYGRSRQRAGAGGAMRVLRFGPVAFVGILLAFAYAEEFLWHKAIWHERAYLFGEPWSAVGVAKNALVPLLALPQVTHYVLDGFIWRRRGNQGRLGLALQS